MTWASSVTRVRYRTENAALDWWDRLHGLCVAAPLGLPTSPGFHFWRCGLRRWHSGEHRTVNYLWSETSPGQGTSTYNPVDSPPPRLDRRPGVRTGRQRRWSRAWREEQEHQRRKVS